MPLAVSNIAWPIELEQHVAARLASCGVDGVEIAPTKVWQKPLEASPAEIASYRRFWESRGLPIVAMQSLLFGQNHLQLFQGEVLREATFEVLTGMIRLAGQLGAHALVFGSPKNRQVGNGCRDEAWDTAISFFRRIGQVASDHGVWLCIEPNPVEYGCDFVTTAAEGLELVRAVNQPGFGLHLDAGGLTLANDPAASEMMAAGPWWRHFHVSEPYLAPIGTTPLIHAPIAQALESSKYSGWLSIEMKASAGFTESLEALDAAIKTCRRAYRGAMPQTSGPRIRSAGARVTL